ncbi:NAD-dependent deacetylase [Pseudomonas sp. NFIX10]|uniref:SIR2 family NAD-dependent protein deacylase n=1 Tax=unclassified Pseudomonas TaxID=196821 RepID=UPI0008F07D5B|nr:MULTISPECIES: NAD-dependent deacylase [unclassified Pseudomonas]SFA87075.1 NAD-dependent deacetylase [Pseudomonas sp. NFIX10]SFE27175.1 NAD-dependent deacetylase [Pseudomonas sp. NFACC06-1]
MNPEVIFAETVKRLRAAKHLAIFTGAGISAQSGISTFRDPSTGLWARYDPKKLATPAAFAKDPAQVWAWYSWRRTLVNQAQPNDAHRAVARLTQSLPRVTVITQNVDDLLERAGSKEVIHLHGDLASARCFQCNRPYLGALPVDVGPDCDSLKPPRCPHCDGRIRPNVVWFGEGMPERELDQAFSAARDCDVMLSIGTSGNVYPAARIPTLATEHGAWLVHINIEPMGPASDKTLVGDATHWLPKLVEALG